MKIKYQLAQNFFLVLTIFYPIIEIQAQNIKLSDNDKVKIIEVILSEINVEPENYRTDEKKILFSTANVPLNFPGTFPKQLDGYKTYLLSKEEIYPGFVFRYHEFDELKVKGNSILINIYNRSIHSKYGVGFRFHKVKGKWKGKVISFYSKVID